MQAHSKGLKSYICIFSVAYTLFFSLTYMLGSVCWLLRVDSGEAGILELTQHRTKTLSHCQAWTFAYLIHLRPIDFPCSVQLCSLLNHTECCVIYHITVEQSHVAPESLCECVPRKQVMTKAQTRIQHGPSSFHLGLLNERKSTVFHWSDQRIKTNVFRAREDAT